VFITGATRHLERFGYRPHTGQHLGIHTPDRSSRAYRLRRHWSPLRFLSLLPEFVPAAKAVHTQLTDQDTSLPAGPNLLPCWRADSRLAPGLNRRHSWVHSNNNGTTGAANL
jgi:hypothetical protein